MAVHRYSRGCADTALSMRTVNILIASCPALWIYVSVCDYVHRYVGADLVALTREAAVIAVNRIFRYMLPTPMVCVWGGVWGVNALVCV